MPQFCEQATFPKHVLGCLILCEQFINQFTSNGHPLLLVKDISLPLTCRLQPSHGVSQSTMPLLRFKVATLSLDTAPLAWSGVHTPLLGQKNSSVFALFSRMSRARHVSPSSVTSFGSDHVHTSLQSPLMKYDGTHQTHYILFLARCVFFPLLSDPASILFSLYVSFLFSFNNWSI